jgi:hypothetical protein
LRPDLVFISSGSDLLSIVVHIMICDGGGVIGFFCVFLCTCVLHPHSDSLEEKYEVSGMGKSF